MRAGNQLTNAVRPAPEAIHLGQESVLNHSRIVTLALAVLIIMWGTTGCGYQFGALWYHMGLGRDTKIPAEYKLPKGAMVILVDDLEEKVQPQTAKLVLVDELARELRDKKIVKQVTTNEELTLLRQNTPNFDQLSIREVGRLAKAETMIWINVEHYSVDDDLDMTVSPGKFSLRVKVFNVNEEDVSKIRLWPSDNSGKFVEAEVGAHLIRRCRNKQEVHSLVGTKAAMEIAQLFYERNIEE